MNQSIVACEEQLQPDVKKALLELLALKERQIEEHQKQKPISIEPPSAHLSPEQQATATDLEAIAVSLKDLKEANDKALEAGSTLAGRAKAVQNVRERLRMLERSYKQFSDETARDLLTLGLTTSDVANLTVIVQPLDDIAGRATEEQSVLKQSTTKSAMEMDELLKRQSVLQTKLNAPQLLYQQSLQEIIAWTVRLGELTGSPDGPESLEGLKARIAQLDALPAALETLRANQATLVGEIFDTLNAQRQSRELLFKPVQDLIQNNSLIRDEYKLQFRATLGGSVGPLSETLFTLIKQNAGDFRGGDDTSYEVVRRLAEQFDFNHRDDALAFVTQLHEKIAAAAGASGKSSIGIASVLRKDKLATDVYDLIFGLAYLEPRYSLLFQDALIEQLSPGQRGALLLIFYLLVDKGRSPIILDQPEENLDNETIVSLLVPVLTEAKKRRQIIMVTHNPNLAVVCDAEQIVWATFDRKDGSKIVYMAGAIENPNINKQVVNVLEGTKPAFDNRRVKYH